MSTRVSTGIQSLGVRCTCYPACHQETSGIPWDQQLPRLSDLWQCRCLHTSWNLGLASDKHTDKHEKGQMLLVNGILYQLVQESWNKLKAHVVSCSAVKSYVRVLQRHKVIDSLNCFNKKLCESNMRGPSRHSSLMRRKIGVTHDVETPYQHVSVLVTDSECLSFVLCEWFFFH